MLPVSELNRLRRDAVSRLESLRAQPKRWTLRSSAFQVSSFKPKVCAKTIAGQEARVEQIDPHPDPLPSDGRGNSQTRLSQLPKRLDAPSNGGRFSLSHPMHPMGEGRRAFRQEAGAGERAPTPEVVFARVLICDSDTRVDGLAGPTVRRNPETLNLKLCATTSAQSCSLSWRTALTAPQSAQGCNIRPIHAVREGQEFALPF